MSSYEIPLIRGVLRFSDKNVVSYVFNDALESLCLVVDVPRGSCEDCFAGFYRVVIGYGWGNYSVDDVRWAKYDVFSKPSLCLDMGIWMEVDTKGVKEETVKELFDTFVESD